MKTVAVYIFCLLCLTCSHVSAQSSYNEYDDTALYTAPEEDVIIGAVEDEKEESETTGYQRKFIKESELEKLREKKSFNYKDWEYQKPEEEVVQRERRTSSNNTTTSSGGFDGTILLWLIGAIVLIAIILQLSGVNLGRIFSVRNEKNTADEGSVTLENIHEIPFDKEINLAIASQNYKLATRLLYLQSLKFLSDKNLIIWTKNKTNRDYEYEIKNRDLRNHFTAITSVFEIVCYGERQLDNDKFLQVQHLFNRFKSGLK